jgi:hypothetical protein
LIFGQSGGLIFAQSGAGAGGAGGLIFAQSGAGGGGGGGLIFAQSGGGGGGGQSGGEPLYVCSCHPPPHHHHLKREVLGYIGIDKFFGLLFALLPGFFPQQNTHNRRAHARLLGVHLQISAALDFAARGGVISKNACNSKRKTLLLRGRHDTQRVRCRKTGERWQGGGRGPRPPKNVLFANQNWAL